MSIEISSLCESRECESNHLPSSKTSQMNSLYWSSPDNEHGTLYGDAGKKREQISFPGEWDEEVIMDFTMIAPEEWRCKKDDLKLSWYAV